MKPSSSTPAKRSPLKIGLVLDDSLDRPDGVQQYVLALGRWYVSQGHSVHYLVGSTQRTDIANIHSLSRNLHVRFNGNSMSIPLPASKSRIKSLLASEQFDILHVQMPYSPFMAARVIKYASPDTVVFGSFHIAPYSRLVSLATSLLALWLRPSLRRFDGVVSVSSAAADLAQRAFKVSTDIVPNTFDYERWHSARPFKSSRNDPRPVVLFLGRLVPRKGCRILLEALVILRNQNDGTLPCRAVICGKGALLTNLQQFVADNNLMEDVTFTGFVSEEDKPRYLASATVAVFPSSGGESFGIVLVEAMASGRTAVLGGDNVGYRSVLGSRAELLFDPHDAHALAEKLTYYLSHPTEQQRVALWGEQYAKQFDVPVVGAELLTRYNKALRKRKHP